MSRLKELREKTARLVAEARERLDQIDDNTPEARRQELEAAHDSAMEEYDRYDKEIERLERQERMEARERERETSESRERREQRRPGGNGSAPGGGQAEKADLRGSFNNLLRFDFGGLSPEERAAITAAGVYTPMHLMTLEERALAAGTDSAGGYTVPTDFEAELEKTLADWGPMMDGRVIRLRNTESGNSFEFPTIDDTAQRGAQFAENAEFTDDGGVDPTFGQVTIAAYLHNSEIVKAPIALLMDSAFDFENDIMPDLFGERMARTANDKLTTGTGSSQPQGIVTGSALGKTAADDAGFTADELIDLQHSVNSAYRRSPKCGWMFNDDTLKMIRKLKDGEGRYVWQGANISQGIPATLLDKPYHVNPSMASPAASAKPVIFGDLNKYMTRTVGGWRIFVFRERYMNFGQLGFMAWGRIDGRVINTAAIKHLVMAAS